MKPSSPFPGTRGRSHGFRLPVCTLLAALVCQSCANDHALTSLDAARSTPGAPTSSPRYAASLALGPGVTSSPAEDGSYAAGTILNYSFVGTDTAAHVLVTIDGAPAAVSGTVMMDRAHQFAATIDNQPGAHAPDFTGVTTDGRTVKLSDYRGKWVFVDFSEANCPGSMNEAAYLQSHYESFRAAGIEVITVLVYGPSGTEVATAADRAAWQQKYGLSFPVISDADGASRIYNHGIVSNTTDFPSGYIVDDRGIIRAKFIGFDGPTIDAAWGNLSR